MSEIVNKIEKEKVLIMAISARTEILNYMRECDKNQKFIREVNILNDIIKTKRNELGYV